MAYLSVAEFKGLKGIDSASDDTSITAVIAAAEKAIDNYTNRTFEGASEERTFDTPHDRTLWINEDLASITTLTNGDGTTIASSAYVTKPRNATTKGVPIYAIQLKSQSNVYWRSASGDYEDAITIEGVWGYSAAVPADIEHATYMLAAYYYDSLDSVGAEIAIVPGVSVTIPQGIPAAVKQLLQPYVREF